MGKADDDRRAFNPRFSDRRCYERRLFDRRLLGSQIRNGNIAEDRRHYDRRAYEQRLGGDRRVQAAEWGKGEGGLPWTTAMPGATEDRQRIDRHAGDRRWVDRRLYDLPIPAERRVRERRSGVDRRA